ncbi:hypothetical protein [Brucella sp. LJL56]
MKEKSIESNNQIAHTTENSSGQLYNISAVPDNSLFSVTIGNLDPDNADTTATVTILVTSYDTAVPAPSVSVIIRPDPAVSGLIYYHNDVELDLIPDIQDGHYEINTDSAGKITLKILSDQVLYASTTFTAPDSTSTSVGVTFDSKLDASLDLGAPIVQGLDDDVLTLDPTEDSFIVRVPPSSSLASSLCVLNIGEIHFLTLQYETAAEIGFTVSYSYLNTLPGNTNVIFYFSQSSVGKTYTSSIIEFIAIGSYENKPKADPEYRSIDEQPYLANHSSIINNNDVLRGDVPVSIDIEPVDGILAGDNIVFTIYINAFKPGTSVPKSNKFDLPVINVSNAEISEKRISAMIPQAQLVGYGGDVNSGKPGSIYIDYAVIGKENDRREPESWLSGYIDTAG